MSSDTSEENPAQQVAENPSEQERQMGDALTGTLCQPRAIDPEVFNRPTGRNLANGWVTKNTP
ncbi:MAG: hypothetical protein HYS26_03445 [Candidatus Kaiserbacteria bacterium]|nr:MAG: hypothetical protein HYS26_03445 [Candidatus Kaiserbacteria bacterium]